MNKIHMSDNFEETAILHLKPFEELHVYFFEDKKKILIL